MKFKAVKEKEVMNNEQENREAARPTTEAQDRQALQGNAAMDGQKVAAAHDQAEKDMEDDAELTASSPNDDLDEGETARLGAGETGLI